MKKIMLGGQAIITGRGSIAELTQVKATRAFIVTGGFLLGPIRCR